MRVLDIYKVVDDNGKFVIMRENHGLHEHFMGDDWSVLPQHVLDWRVFHMSVGNDGTLFIYCE